MRWLVLFLGIVVVGCSGGGSADDLGDALGIKAADGTIVSAELVPAKGKAMGVVLMFHQAGSNRHEYDPIAPRIAERGWDCLKVDQRAGGSMWGDANPTASRAKGDKSYESAYPDLEAALNWAEGEGYEKVVAWGSSYSASLALRLASEHDTVDAVIAYSPGEYFDEKGVVAKWNSGVKVPTYVAATSEELTVGGVYTLLDSKPDVRARDMDLVFGTKDGVHGSSALREDKNPRDQAAYWKSLEKFLRSFETGGKNFGG